MYGSRQPRSGFFRHLAVPPTVGGSASHISALVKIEETSQLTTCGRRCALSAEICSTTAVWTFACRYSSGGRINPARALSYTGLHRGSAGRVRCRAGLRRGMLTSWYPESSQSRGEAARPPGRWGARGEERWPACYVRPVPRARCRAAVLVHVTLRRSWRLRSVKGIVGGSSARAPEPGRGKSLAHSPVDLRSPSSFSATSRDSVWPIAASRRFQSRRSRRHSQT